MNTFTIKVEETEYLILIKSEQNPVSYEVVNGDMLWILHMNDFGRWEAATTAL